MAMLILLVVCQTILVLLKPQTGALSNIMTTEWQCDYLFMTRSVSLGYLQHRSVGIDGLDNDMLALHDSSRVDAEQWHGNRARIRDPW